MDGGTSSGRTLGLDAMNSLAARESFVGRAGLGAGGEGHGGIGAGGAAGGAIGGGRGGMTTCAHDEIIGATFGSEAVSTVRVISTPRLVDGGGGAAWPKKVRVLAEAESVGLCVSTACGVVAARAESTSASVASSSSSTSSLWPTSSSSSSSSSVAWSTPSAPSSSSAPSSESRRPLAPIWLPRAGGGGGDGAAAPDGSRRSIRVPSVITECTQHHGRERSRRQIRGAPRVHAHTHLVSTCLVCAREVRGVVWMGGGARAPAW